MTPSLAPVSLGVVGAGRAAGALIPRLLHAGHAISWQQPRRDDTPLEARPAVDVVLIAVRDGDIAGVLPALAARPSAKDEVWLHLSGSLPGSAARADAHRPRAAGCLHPIAALSGASGTAPLDAVAGIDGDEAACTVAERLASDVGLYPRRVVSDAKVLYHAAAVSVAGHATALVAQAMRLMARAGMPEDDARLALASLMGTAATNLRAGPAAAVITGPIARGDVGTVRAHLEALAAHGDPAITAVYRLLAKEALDISAPALGAEERADLRRLIEG